MLLEITSMILLELELKGHLLYVEKKFNHCAYLD